MTWPALASPAARRGRASSVDGARPWPWRTSALAACVPLLLACRAEPWRPPRPERTVSATRVAQLGSLDGHGDGVRAAAFAPDGRTLATGSGSSLCLWRMADWALVARAPTPADALAFSPDGTLVSVQVAAAGYVVTWHDPATGAPRTRSTLGLEYPLSHALEPGGRWLVAGTAAGAVTRLDLIRGGAAWTREDLDVAADSGSFGGLVALANGVAAVAVSPTTRRVAAAFMAGEVVVLDADSGATVLDFSVAGEVEGWCLGLTFSPDGRVLVVEARDGLSLWDPASGERLGRLGPPGTYLAPAAFAPDGVLVAARGHDGATRLFELATRAEAGRVGGDPVDLAFGLWFGPAGQLVVGDRGGAWVWALEPR